MYIARFNYERKIVSDQDKKIMLVALLGGIWPRSPFMAKLAKKTPTTLSKFMDKADNFVNVEDTLRALTVPRDQIWNDWKNNRVGEH